MGLLECASNRSTWLGYEYFEKKRVRNVTSTADGVYEGIVDGTRPYRTKIDLWHPRRSACDCPFADGRRIVCKHMVALYFTAFPDQAAQYYKEVEEAEAREELRLEEAEQRLLRAVNNMSANELRTELLNLLYESPDWIFERFMEQHCYDDD